MTRCWLPSRRSRCCSLHSASNNPPHLLLHTPTAQVPNEADEVLAAKRAHKVLECDLTGDDELAPAWKVKQEEAHTVT